MDQASERLTYREVGATRSAAPTGYRHDRHSVEVGHGDDAYHRAVEGLRRWEPHRHADIALHPVVPPIEEGVTVIQAIALPVLSAIAACRIVYVIDEPHKFGFAYGTLPAHPEQGEEAFIVEMQAGGGVEFVITAFSRPRHPLARFGSPVTRRIQLAVTNRYLEGLQKYVAAS
jgi:uncharacterized protein (UPF0548 family)